MPVHLVKGSDESLVRHAVHELVDRLVGDADRSLVVEDYDDDEYELRAVVDAAQTPPFLTDLRVVVARGIGRFAAADLDGLLTYLGDPLPTTELVLAQSGGRVVKALNDALKKVGATVIDSAPPSRARDLEVWVRDRAVEHGVALDAGARSLIADWLGEETGRIDGLLETLRSTHGEGAQLERGDVLPFLGEAGGVPPWDLTDAIDRGDTGRALELLRRMLRGGERHPLQVMAILQANYLRMAALDGREVRSKSEAATALGIKEFPAGKSLDNLRRLGGDGTRRAIDLLAQADLDLRGDRELPEELVMEVLVARLSRLGSAAGGGRGVSRRR